MAKRRRVKQDIKLRPGTHIHLVGIGGTGLSAIARVLLGRRFVVSGSDQEANDVTADLAQAGASVYQGHEAVNIAGADLLLVSSAVPESNPEIAAAQAAGIPVLKRSEFLGLVIGKAFTIAVAGTHGKTTTAAMIAQTLIQADFDPTVILGGILPLLGTNGRAGHGDYFVIEADEYDRMFLGLQPQTAVITNVEYDHPDLYATPADYRDAFGEFAGRIAPGGRLVICADDQGVSRLIAETPHADVAIETYGLGTADWQALDLRLNQLGGTDFVVQRHGESVGLARLRVPGEHNVRNALAAIVVCSQLQIDFNTMRQSLADFGGVARRFEIMGQVEDVTVIDDYAHHPTEIRATLSAAKQRFPGRRLWAVWQPHTFSRTRKMLSEFASSFGSADRVVALDVYRSREPGSQGVDTSNVLEAMDHPDAHHIGDIGDASDFIVERIRPGDVIVLLTAGDGNIVGKRVLEELRQRSRVAQRSSPIVR